ncbi:hypothetical protein SAMN05660463_01744 [Pseudomonas sp. URIL14HWK12:I9]|nr:hypothetical protein F474_02848 [Pseudomonas sp. URIL14HWK12:I12]PVZ24070.1 hypothetical protein F470_02503 [Pseudomonas sp. URIL14HWK12:I10]PVZ33291.1 hypothetical protein F472_02759 [Pseudomonas sp. URIL14HWK12:I11]SNZ11030.1 hypothetical protein SAMN05660463_01744 [Pseudomonas sp. URIL14HWK12:I9]
MHWMVFFAGLVVPSDVLGQVVQRCPGESGHVTYTFGACPDGTAGESVRAYNPPPGTVAPHRVSNTPRVAVPLVIVGNPAPQGPPAVKPPKPKLSKAKSKRPRYRTIDH